MSSIDDVFHRLRSEGRKALIPFLTAGDPDLEFTAAALREFGARGAALCEVGVPYSDPIADGPVIQASYTRALARKVKLSQILAMTTDVAPTLPCPVATMVSYAVVHRYGPERFVAAAQRAGLAGAIVPDLLVEESAALAETCRRADFSLIQLVTPTTPRDRAVRIAERSGGFIYYVSITGITGERTQISDDLAENVAWLRSRTSLPICIGFGISTPEHVRQLAPAADGLIVGSAVVRRLAAAATEPRDRVLHEVGEYLATLKAALG